MRPALRLVLSLSVVAVMVGLFHSAGWFMKGGLLAVLLICACIMIFAVAVQALMEIVANVIAGPDTSE